MKQKNLNKRIRRLEASIAKDTRKLAKLRRKLAAAASRAEKKPKPRESTPSRRPGPAAATPKAKKTKRQLSPEARAKLATMMKQRWAAKRAAASAANTDSDGAVGWPANAAPPG